MRDHRYRGAWAIVPIIAVLSVAVGLRFWRLSWGLDLGSFPDELVWTVRSSAFVPLSANSFALSAADLIYPPLYGYAAGAVTAVGNAVGLVRPGALSSDVCTVVRGVSATAGVVTVGLVGLAGRRMFSPRVGFAAAALMAVAPLHAMQAHVAAPDAFMTAFGTLAILLAYEVAVRGTGWLAALAGAAAGLAASAKYPGLAFIVPVGWAIVERFAVERRLASVLTMGVAALGGLGAAAALACPPCVLHVDWMLHAMGAQSGLTIGIPTTLFLNNQLQPSLGWYGRPYLYELVASLPYGLGWPLYALALLGLGVAVARRQVADRILLAALVPYFAVIGSSQVAFPKYMMPLYPGLVLLAARAFSGLGGRRLAVAAVAGVWLYSFVLATTQVARFSYRQQSAVAHWLAAARPPRPGAAVRVAVPYLLKSLDYYHLMPALAAAGLTPVFADPGHWLDGKPDALVLPEWLEIALRRDVLGTEGERAAARDLEKLQSGALGYSEAQRWRSWYLQRDFYTWLDPAFAGDLWQGEIGFAVYLPAVPSER